MKRITLMCHFIYLGLQINQALFAFTSVNGDMKVVTLKRTSHLGLAVYILVIRFGKEKFSVLLKELKQKLKVRSSL